MKCYYFFFGFSHFWLATVQEVLQADWQDAWHSPQPAKADFFEYVDLLSVFTFFILDILSNMVVSI